MNPSLGKDASFFAKLVKSEYRYQQKTALFRAPRGVDGNWATFRFQVKTELFCAMRPCRYGKAALYDLRRDAQI
jgi:hypothetical protein